MTVAVQSPLPSGPVSLLTLASQLFNSPATATDAGDAPWKVKTSAAGALRDDAAVAGGDDAAVVAAGAAAAGHVITAAVGAEVVRAATSGDRDEEREETKLHSAPTAVLASVVTQPRVPCQAQPFRVMVLAACTQWATVPPPRMTAATLTASAISSGVQPASEHDDE